MFDSSIEQRAVELAAYIVQTQDTVRGAAKKFGISKSTVHKDVTQRLEHINAPLFQQVNIRMNGIYAAALQQERSIRL